MIYVIVYGIEIVRYRVDGNMHVAVVVVCTCVLLVPDVLTQELNIGKFCMQSKLNENSLSCAFHMNIFLYNV